MIAASETYATTKTLEIAGDNGAEYAYRSVGDDTIRPPLLLLQYFAEVSACHG